MAPYLHVGIHIFLVQIKLLPKLNETRSYETDIFISVYFVCYIV